MLSLQASLLDLREGIVLELQSLRDMEAFAPMNADYYDAVNKAERALVKLDEDLRKLGTRLEKRAGRLEQSDQGLWVRLWSFIRRHLQPGQ